MSQWAYSCSLLKRFLLADSEGSAKSASHAARTSEFRVTAASLSSLLRASWAELRMVLMVEAPGGRVVSFPGPFPPYLPRLRPWPRPLHGNPGRSDSALTLGKVLQPLASQTPLPTARGQEHRGSETDSDRSRVSHPGSRSHNQNSGRPSQVARWQDGVVVARRSRRLWF